MKGTVTAKENPQGFASDQLSTIQVTKRLDRSIPMFLLHHLIKPMKGKLITPKEESPAGSQQLEVHKSVKNKIDAIERKVGDIYIYDISPKKQGVKNASSDKKLPKRIYYFAGGGWQMPPSGEHWSMIAELATRLSDSTAVSLVSYPLAPNSSADVSFPQLMNMYRTVMKESSSAGESVILAGDSSGGNIVLCLLANSLLEDRATQNLQPCPTAVMVISPSTDLRRQNPDITSIAKHDPVLAVDFINSTAKKWRGEIPPTDIRVSPLYADLTPIHDRNVKVHGVCARYDILGPDGVLFREKCNQANIHGEWLDWEKQMHVFPMAFKFKLPESVAGKEWILDVLRRT